MTLPSSGQISLSQINTELGRTSTLLISLDTAESDGYVTLQTYCPPKPNNAQPASMSEWYSYNHNPTTLGASASTTTIDTTCSDEASCDPGDSATVTNTPSGGCGGNTFSWIYVSGEAFTVNSPTSATTSFNYGGSIPCGDGVHTGVYKGRVTDNQSHTADTANITITFENDYGGTCA